MNSIIRLIEELESLDFSMDFHLQMDIILQSLSESFGQTIANFHMNKIDCQKAIQGSKAREVALIASSSRTKKKANNKHKGKTSIIKPTERDS